MMQTTTTQARAGAVLAALCALATSVTVTADDFTYNTNESTIAIAGYIGAGGAVTIPDTVGGLPVTSIDAFAFDGATNVTQVVIGTNVTFIGGWAFRGCSALVSVTIPDSVDSIGDAAFAYNTSLLRVTIPDAVTSLENGTFSDCYSLSRVTIGSGVASIAGYVFYNCSQLKGLYFKGDAPGSVDGTAFEGVAATVYYLPGKTGWGETFGGLPTALWPPQIQTSDGSFGVRTNRFGFNITWVSGTSVAVDACTNLVNPAWLPVRTNSLVGESVYFSDAQWTNRRASFYRLRVP